MSQTINTREAYEKLAKRYSAKIDVKPHNAFYDRPNTLSLLPSDLKNKHILDAGCGPGKYAEIILNQGAQVTGVDLSKNMIAEARKRNKEKGEFLVHDLTTTLPFSDQAFDIVLCPLVLEYIYDWNPVFREFKRVLKPGGIFVFSVTHPFFDYQYFRTNQYFETEKVSAIWRGFGEPIKIESYRRSLMDCVTPLMNNGFTLDKLVEPLPVAEFEQHDAKHYEELMEFPAFLHLRAIKAT
ncbi:MAG: class I SAM-dependent methyltransferase [Cyclobacteriaceae bacterium]